MNIGIVINSLSAIYVLFLPGFFLTFVFFKPGNANILERFILSFGLSIAIVPIVVFYTSLAGIPITSFSVMLCATGVTLLTGILLFIQYWRSRT